MLLMFPEPSYPYVSVHGAAVCSGCSDVPGNGGCEAVAVSGGPDGDAGTISCIASTRMTLGSRLNNSAAAADIVATNPVKPSSADGSSRARYMLASIRVIVSAESPGNTAIVTRYRPGM